MDLFLAAISAQSLTRSVLFVIVIGLVCWLLWWLVDFIGIPEPFRKVARVLIAVFAVFVLINALLSLVGSPIVTF